MLNETGFITKVNTDEDENLTLEFPDGLLDTMGWKEGDRIKIQAVPGRVILSRVSIDEDM